MGVCLGVGLRCVRARPPRCVRLFVTPRIAVSLGNSIFSFLRNCLFFFFKFFPHLDYYRICNRVPCAIQLILVDYLFYIE